jgi:hypothetical protein
MTTTGTLSAIFLSGWNRIPTTLKGVESYSGAADACRR